MEKSLFRRGIFAAAFALFLAANASALDRYEPVEFSYTSARAYSNPYTDVTVDAVVTRPDGTRFTQPLYWDGGARWTLRVAGTQAGAYAFTTVCSDGSNAGLEGKTGGFTVGGSFSSAWAPRGWVEVDPDHPLYFRYSDGGPFVLTGDTQWRLVWEDKGMSASEFTQVIDARAAQKFNYIQWTLWETMGGGRLGGELPFGNSSTSQLNPAYFQTLDGRVQYMVKKGLASALMYGWSDNGFYSVFSDSARRRFQRYLVARYGAYNTVWMCVGEYNESGSASQHEDTVNYLKSIDPYRHPITMHPRPGTPGGNIRQIQDWYSTQRGGAGDWGYDDARSGRGESYGTPYVNSEYGYEDDGAIPQDGAVGVLQDIWGLMVGGGAGQVYGASGVWSGDMGNLAMTGAKDYIPAWKKFWEEGGTDFRLFDRFSKPQSGLMLAGKTGGDTVVWARTPNSFTLNLSGNAGQSLSCRWYDARTGEWGASFSQTGGGAVAFTAPDGVDDKWILLIQKASAAPQLSVTAPAAGAAWSIGAGAVVSWTSTGVQNVKILLSRDGGAAWSELATVSAASGSWTWPSVSAPAADKGLIRLEDSANSSLAGQSGSFIITSVPDSTPPALSIVQPDADGQTFRGSVSVAGTASDGSGVARVEWQLDSTTGPWTPAEGAADWTFAVPPPSDGPHRLYVRAADVGSPANASAPSVRAFSADNRAPVLSDIRAYAGETSAIVQWATDEASSSQVQYGVEGPSSDTGLAETGKTSHSVALNGLTANTAYRFTVNSQDALGNESTSGVLTFITAGGASASLRPPPALRVVQDPDDPAQSILSVSGDRPEFAGDAVAAQLVTPKKTVGLELIRSREDAALLYAKVPRDVIDPREFSAAVPVSLLIGGRLFEPTMEINIVVPSLGGRVQDPLSDAAVVLPPGSALREIQITFSLEADGDVPLHEEALGRQGLTSLGAARGITFTPAESVRDATLILPVDMAHISDDILTRAKIAYYNPSLREWVLGETSVIGRSLRARITNAAASIYKPVLPALEPLAEGEDVTVTPYSSGSTSDPVLRVAFGNIEELDIRIFNSVGHLVHSATLLHPPSYMSGGRSYTEYVWQGAKESDAYVAVIKARTAESTIMKNIPFVIAK